MIDHDGGSHMKYILFFSFLITHAYASNLIDNLPKEVLVKIFQHLYHMPDADPIQTHQTLSCVNKKWFRIMEDESFQTYPRGYVENLNRPFHYVQELLKLNPNQTGQDLYKQFCTEQRAEMKLLEIPYDSKQDMPSLHDYQLNEALVEEKNIEIWREHMEEEEDIWSPTLNYLWQTEDIYINECTRIPVGLWEKLKDNIPELNTEPLSLMIFNTKFPIRYVPPCFFKGVHIQHLSLSEQKLINLPKSILNIKDDLIYLDIGNRYSNENFNIFSEIPAILNDFKKLEYINTDKALRSQRAPTR